MIGEPSPLRLALESGRSLTVSQCDCGHCKNEWYVPNHNDFTPQYCPYCGIKFIRCDDSNEWNIPPKESTQ